MNKKFIGLAAAPALLAAGFTLRARHDTTSTTKAVSSDTDVGDRHTAPRAHLHHHAAPYVNGEGFDLDDVMKRTHFAFERVGDAFVGGDSTYAVVTKQRTVEVAPDASSDPERHTGRAHSLRLRTAAITRGSQSLVTVASDYAREDDGTLSLQLGADIVETLENRVTGLEQSWTFDSKPQASGALAVEVAVDGEAFVGGTDTGVHFQDVEARIGTVYGAAHWVDARGTSTAVAMRYEGNRIRIEVPEDLIESSTYPAVLDPTIGPEYSIDTPIIAPAADIQRAPAIGHPETFNAEFTVVWQDRRRSLGMNYDIYMASVSRTGVVNTPVGQPVNDLNEEADHLSPKIYKSIVVYTSNAATNGLYATYVKDLTTGTVRQVGFPNVQSVNDCSSPTITGVFDTSLGTSYAIAWREGPRAGGNGKIMAATVGSDLRIQVSQTPITAGTFDANSPAIAGQASFNNPRLLLVWSDNQTGKYNIHGSFMSTSLSQIRAETLSTENSLNATRPAVATFGGTASPYDGFIVAWQRPLSTNFFNPNYDIFGQYVSGAGALPYPTQFTISAATQNQQFPSVAGFGPNNTQVLVAWSDHRDGLNTPVRGTRINMSPAPTLVDTTSLSFGGQVDAASGVDVHSDELSAYFAVWGDSRNGSYTDIYGGNIAFSAAPNATVGNYLISASANKQTAPAFVHCGNRYLVAWSDSRNLAREDSDIYGALVDETGAVIGSSFPISTAAGIQDVPAIGCTRTTGTFFVAWTDQRNGNSDIYGTPVLTDGTVVSPSGIALAASSAAETYPALANDSTGYFWLTYNSGTSTVWGTQFDSNGTLKTAPMQLISAGTNADIDFDAVTGKFLIVYQVFQDITKTYDIWGAAMTVQGSVTGPFVIEQATGDQRYPCVRFDASGGTALVAYEDDRNLATEGTDIIGHRVNTTSVLGGTLVLAASTANEYGPRLTTRTGSLQELTYWSGSLTTHFDFDVYGQSLNAGAPSGAAFAISNGVGVREMTPSIGCTTTTCIVPYRSYDPGDQTTGVDRIKARVLSY